MSIFTTHIVTLGDRFAEATGRSRATVSTLVLNDGKRLEALANGKDIGGRRYEAAMAWFAAHWPAGAEWPAGVPRPAPQASEPEAAA
ncbi:hypothetical protein [Prosthecomicrobium hirschii]|uniref:Uncharacterized protein n=1 Tax=Prosthecodimorpha hirschii TaxID=665126 RepID=A0A0P6WL85_9HYPH|nr:hypothetical protein [Prosthecomicrobium hirschii]KPL55549.1 hypothetical protein ABB55_27685 [Prosthecomicrobium hirschii]MCW1839463.1 hypothetical protein [Prosthecomicrobium hirschii]